MIVAGGVATSSWHGLTGWFEAGSSIRYRYVWSQAPRFSGDYRGGVSFSKGFGRVLGSETPGLFFEMNADGIYVSEFQNDVMLYTQTRMGVTPPRVAALGSIETQFFWNNNLVRDAKSLDWANYVETGPGFKFRWPWMPKSLQFSVSALRGEYTVPQWERKATFDDVRIGFWYAITR